MTPAIALCRARGVDIRIHEFTHTAGNTRYGAEAACALSVEAGRIFKTLMVCTDNRTYALALVSVAQSLDLKAVAGALGVKKVALADVKVVQSRSGYLIGGISPLAHKRACPLLLDGGAAQYESILVSGGKRGLEIEIAPADLLMLSEGQYANIAA